MTIVRVQPRLLKAKRVLNFLHQNHPLWINDTQYKRVRLAVGVQYRRGGSPQNKMSHPYGQEYENTKEDGLLYDSQMSLSKALDEMYDPYESIRNESLRDIMSDNRISYPHDEY